MATLPKGIGQLFFRRAGRFRSHALLNQGINCLSDSLKAGFAAILIY